MLVLLYVDPGSGSLIVQVLASVLIGGWLYARRQIASVVRAVLGRRRVAQSAPPPSDEP